jgi:paraquat-inducible protein A
MPPSTLIACHECDVLQRETSCPSGGTARCIRCDAMLYRSPSDGLNRSLAFSFGAALLFFLANVYPLATLDAKGAISSATLFESALALYDQNKPLVASLVLVTTILVPAANIVGMIYLLLPLRFCRKPRGASMIFRLIYAMRPWAMIEVFMLGALVTIVKLVSIAEVTVGVGLWALAGLMLLQAAAASSFDSRDFWRRMAAVEEEQRLDSNTVEATHS